jgi:hypothetical protein
MFFLRNPSECDIKIKTTESLTAYCAALKVHLTYYRLFFSHKPSFIVSIPFVIHKKADTELIIEPADAKKENMGLTS